MTEPLSEIDLDRLETAGHTVEGWQISPADALRLCDIARGRARLVICSDCAKARAQHNELVAERDALRAENAKLREALGMMSTAAPRTVVDSLRPIEWAIAVVEEVRVEHAAARADSDLLAKVEVFLKGCGDLTLYELCDNYYIDDPPTRITAPTLREALRKLVGEES